MKNQKGITLVALVITIIVLLILAGVSISLVVGNNGVLTQASGSVIKDNVAKVKEDLTMALASCETTYYTKWAQNSATTRASVYEGTTANTDGAFIAELTGKYNVQVLTAAPTVTNNKIDSVSNDSVADGNLVKTTTPADPAYVVLTKKGSTGNETYVFTLTEGVAEESGAYTIGSTVTYQVDNQDSETVTI